MYENCEVDKFLIRGPDCELLESETVVGGNSENARNEVWTHGMHLKFHGYWSLLLFVCMCIAHNEMFQTKYILCDRILIVGIDNIAVVTGSR